MTFLQYMYSPVLSSILVLESTDVFDFPGRGGLRGTMVGTAIDPAVMVTKSCHTETHKTEVQWRKQRAGLTSNILWANSADDKLMTFFFYVFFLENRLWQFMQIVSFCNLHEMSKPIFWENYFKMLSKLSGKTISKCCLFGLCLIMLNVKFWSWKKKTVHVTY